MEAGTKLISGVVQKDTILRIPYFQRRYVWQETDWERFAIDMESTLDSERNYFLGAIILKEETVTREDKKGGIAQKFLVIDGQQRLTTLSIYMKVLYMMNLKNDDFGQQYLQDNTSKDPVLKHCCDDSREFQHIMHLDTASKAHENSNIAKAYNYFLSYLTDAKKRGVNLLELMNTVKSSITFVVITLKGDDDEQQIFDTINSLGVPLTTDELLKNFLYEADDEVAYNQTWKKMFDEDKAREFWGTDVSSTKQTKNTRVIERFMYAFVRLKMWDFKDQLTDSQRKMYVKTENVFTTCKDFVEKFGMKKQDLANEILEYAKLYKNNLNVDILDQRIPSSFGIKRLSCFINASGSYVVLPLVLYILKNVKDESERNLMFGYLETYLIRRVLCFPVTYNNDYKGQFSEYIISNRIDSYDKLKEYFEAKSSTQNLRMPSDIEMVLGIGDKALDETTARLIYYMYETRLVSTAAGTFNGGYNDYSAAQLMPKPNDKLDAYWPKDSDPDTEKSRVKRIKTIGNYFILDCKTDCKAIKKCVYDTLADKVTVFLSYSKDVRSSEAKLKNITEWTEGKINARNSDFVKVINEKIWSLK